MLLVNRRIFNLDDYSDNIFNLEEIAHALSFTCRWGGNCNVWNSVAEHSVMVSREMEEFKAYGLLHDCSEWIFPDLPSPLAKVVPDYKRETEKLQKVIYKKFDLFWEEPKELKKADLKIREKEYQDYVIGSKESWNPEEGQFWFLTEARKLGIPFQGVH